MSMRLTLFSLAIVSALLAACSGSSDTGGLANGGQSAGETPKAPPPSGGGATGRTPEQTPPAPPTPEQTKCDVSFGKDVLPALAEHGCQNAQCHGGGVQQPKVSVLDSKATYASFTQYKMRGGLPYVRTTGRPDESGIHCHVRNDCGTPMPPFGGRIDSEVVDLIDDWLKCGAPNN